MKPNRRRYALLIAATAIVVALAFWVREYTQSPNARIQAETTPPETGGIAGLDEESQAEVVAQSTDSPQLGSSGTEDGLPLRSEQIEARAQRSSEAVGPLLVLARSGDSSAVAALDRIVGRCLRIEQRFGSVVPGNQQVGIAQDQALQRAVAYCDLTDEEFHALADEIAAMERDLALAGDVAAMARYLRTPIGDPDLLGISLQEALDLAFDAAQSSSDPEVVRSTLDLLFNHWGGAGMQVPSIADANAELMRDPRLSLTPIQRREEIRRLAVELLACEIGADCGPYGPRQDYFCVELGNCASELGMTEFVRQRLLTPSEFQALTRFLEALRRLREGG